MNTSEIDTILNFLLNSKKNPILSKYYQGLFLNGICDVNNYRLDARYFPSYELEKMSPRHLNFVDPKYGTIIIRAILGNRDIPFSDTDFRNYVGDPVICLNIIKCGHDYIDFGFIDRNRRTALIYTCLNGLEDVGIKLVETGKSQPSAIDVKGNTALIYCCKFRRFRIAEKLLDVLSYSDISHKDRNETTALDYLKYIVDDYQSEPADYSTDAGTEAKKERYRDTIRDCNLLIDKINEINTKNERQMLGEISLKKKLPRELQYTIAEYHSLGSIKGQKTKKGGKPKKRGKTKRK